MERGREWVGFTIHQLKIKVKNMLVAFLYSPIKRVIKKCVSMTMPPYLYSPIKN